MHDINIYVACFLILDTQRRIDHIGVVELGLAKARASIRRAISAQNYSTDESDDGRFVPRGAIYRNPYAFHR